MYAILGFVIFFPTIRVHLKGGDKQWRQWIAIDKMIAELDREAKENGK